MGLRREGDIRFMPDYAVIANLVARQFTTCHICPELTHGERRDSSNLIEGVDEFRRKIQGRLTGRHYSLGRNIRHRVHNNPLGINQFLNLIELKVFSLSPADGYSTFSPCCSYSYIRYDLLCQEMFLIFRLWAD